MAHYFSLVLLIIFSPLQVWCQTPQNDWIAPASPDRATNMQAGTPFTLRWKSSLQNWFPVYCNGCDVQKLDLWVTSYNNYDYTYKIAAGIDVTATSSYQWDVNLPSAALLANNFWVLRFVAFNSAPSSRQEISSAGFYISALSQPSTSMNTVTVQSSSTASSIAKPTSLTSTVPLSASATAPATVTNITSIPNPASKSQAWIAGVVIGPIIGIALGAALMWLLLSKKRKNRVGQRNQDNLGYAQESHHSVEKYPQLVIQSLPSALSHGPHPLQHQAENYRQYPVEVPVNEPAELWHQDHRLRS